MIVKDYKLIDINDCPVGSNFCGIHYPPNRVSFGPTYTVLEKTETAIKCLNPWTNNIDMFSRFSNIKVEIPLTLEEEHQRDFNKAKELAQAVKHELYDAGDAYHEMWNAWACALDPYDMAKTCEENNIMVLGYFKLNYPARILNLDIGLVAEDKDGERFWCHVSSSWFENWEEDYPELYK